MQRTGPARGIQRISPGKFNVRLYVTDPRTGRQKEVKRIVKARTLEEAILVKVQLREQILADAGASLARLRVGDFARSWIRSKALEVDEGTIDLYTDALERHVLPALGDFYLDALRRSDVQEWVTRSLTEPRWRGEGKERRQLRPYGIRTVHGWYRAFRTMVRDAIDEHGLDHDPTARIKFPPMPEATEPKGITPEQLSDFLGALQSKYPQHYAMVVLMAYTGMRFCHASALRWEDLVETSDGYVLHVRRKQRRGKIGPVSRKKRAPKTLGLPVEIAEILKAERKRMIAKQVKGVAEGYMFPSSTGTFRQPSSLFKAWTACAKAARIEHRFTVHGTRYTFTDLGRLSGMKDDLRQEIAGHTPEMVRHYSTHRQDEQRAGLAQVVRLVPLTPKQVSA